MSVRRPYKTCSTIKRGSGDVRLNQETNLVMQMRCDFTLGLHVLAPRAEVTSHLFLLQYEPRSFNEHIFPSEPPFQRKVIFIK